MAYNQGGQLYFSIVSNIVIDDSNFVAKEVLTGAEGGLTEEGGCIYGTTFNSVTISNSNFQKDEVNNRGGSLVLLEG
jgi:hypothetical protein